MNEQEPGRRIERSVLMRAHIPDIMVRDSVLYLPRNPELALEANASPELIEGERRIRVDKLGQLFISSFEDAPDGYEIPEELTAHVRRAAKSRPYDKVSFIDWSRPKSIESAIEMTGKIKEPYDREGGEQMVNARALIETIKSFTQGLELGSIRADNLDRAAERIAEALVETKYDSARKPNKQEIKDLLIRAASPDIKDRFNPARSRLLATHAWTGIIKELVFGTFVHDKYERLEFLLMREREMERFALTQVIEGFNKLSQMGPRHKELRSAKREFQGFVRETLSQREIKVGPYREIATIVRVLTSGPDHWDPELLKHFDATGEKGYEEQLGAAPFLGLSYGQFLGRMDYCKGLITSALADAEVQHNNSGANPLYQS